MSKRKQRHGKVARNAVATKKSRPDQPIVIHQAALHGTIEADDAVALRPLPRAPRPPRTKKPAPPELHAVPEPVPAPSAGSVRAYSVDALRGFFLLLMTLGFTIQGDMFPEWMYHRQTPGDTVVDIAGIAWRDLAYAAFLFTMAAALPITLSRRIARGETELGIFFASLRRGFLLFVFALLIAHSNTYFTGYTQEARVVAIAGFALMFLLFTRRRADWNERWFKRLRNVGWLAAIAFLAFTPALYGESFSFARRDQVIAELMFAAVVGSTLWYATRHHLGWRLAALAAAVALFALARNEGPVQQWWYSSPAPWLFLPRSLTLLAVIVPGTMAGDLVVRWMNLSGSEHSEMRWSRARLTLLATLAIMFTPVVVIGLYNRLVLTTTLSVIVLAIAGLVLMRGARQPDELVLRGMFAWSAAWLLLGLLLDPLENGIRKVPETLSYFFTVTGTTMMTLVAFLIIVDILRRRKLMRPLIEVGQNPMICYVVFTVFLNSLFELIPALRPVLRATPGGSILRSLLTVALVIVLVQMLTRKRIFWRT